jgi:dTDP-4-amino-4,6-dideoxygalactose transaminase
METHERRFYSLNEDMLDRIVREVVAEELSVVEGGILERFEESVAEFFGARHAVAVCNGTAALHLALFALDLQPGEEVLIAAYGYYATALPVCMMGGVPIFCDIRQEDLTLNVEEAEQKVSPRTRALIVLQPWGCPADVDALLSLADRHGLTLISDSSHAPGALWKGRPLGHYYDFVCTSLGKGKLISGGELGAVTTNDDYYRDRMLLYGHVNRVPNALITSEYRHIQNSVGVKYRPHPFAMTLAMEQLQTYDERSRHLVQTARRFEEELSDIAGFSTFSSPEKSRRVYWRIPVRVDEEMLGSTDSVLQSLEERNCPVEQRGRVLIPRHSVFTEFYGVKTPRSFPVAERLCNEIFQVHPFALYNEQAIQQVLDGFRYVAETGARKGAAFSV